MSRPLRLVQHVTQPIEFCCPLCGNVNAAYIFGTARFRIFRCAGCALTFSKESSFGAETAPAAQWKAAQRASPRAQYHEELLLAELGATAIEGPVLVVADPADAIVSQLERRGIAIARVVTQDDFGAPEWGQIYHCAIVSSTLMRVTDPHAALRKIRRHLTVGASIFLSLPLLDGTQARLMGRNWHEWKAGNLWYFTRETLNLMLLAAGFENVLLGPQCRRYSFDKLTGRMPEASTEIWLRRLETIRRAFSRRLRHIKFRMPFGTAIISAKAAPTRTENVVSIVVPVFNERATFQIMMDALLAKQLPGVRKEIILVESNSTDGSRDLVESYRGHPDVRVVLQPAPRGKGNAVREGLAIATGDIVLIQDADLEYDFDDYDGLLAPLMAWQSMFILGSRHQGTWKVREFIDTPFIAAVFNFGHWFFTNMMNLVLNTRMSDPFTMFKIFRRDALYGIDFMCNRFDFDIELVIKLVRKGYIPVELPVNYISRSFAEGKKVSFTRDGMTWLWTILTLRLSSMSSEAHERTILFRETHESARQLARLGGTQPDLTAPPRRRLEPR